MTDQRQLEELLRADEGDAGCAAGEDILDAYVELELAGVDPARRIPAPPSTCEAVPAAGPITRVCSKQPAASPTSTPHR